MFSVFWGESIKFWIFRKMTLEEGGSSSLQRPMCAPSYSFGYDFQTSTSESVTDSGKKVFNDLWTLRNDILWLSPFTNVFKTYWDNLDYQRFLNVNINKWINGSFWI